MLLLLPVLLSCLWAASFSANFSSSPTCSRHPQQPANLMEKADQLARYFFLTLHLSHLTHTKQQWIIEAPRAFRQMGTMAIEGYTIRFDGLHALERSE